ncbi:adaptor protein MecA [Cytobacillus sp. IB215665]|uniref:adaptor protein MecA n=1 Tax=Cytobacillus sp. IB215665 TaxID=3097357 RepID=UPI002A172271|nr:adaptor protein MecA [Cytobacillus sp. IB215665]MDX8364428.1 adaptor protein MecA [Cytobacillus sp. IB215665]
MEIERINENTVKFYISYLDIEERGFDRDEIWYNRERSEELFWEMMDEIHQEEDFVVEGPLWIQVQALDKGLEVLVTKAQLSKDGNRYEIPLSEDRIKELPVDEKIEELLDQQFSPAKDDYNQNVNQVDDEQLEFLLRFDDFEHIIALSHRIDASPFKNRLFSFEGHYYLYVEFNEENMIGDELDAIISLLLEYGQETTVTIHRLEEYGNEIIKEDALAVIANHFPSR